jgi:hypothetical protein
VKRSASARAQAVRALSDACPRCGARRERDQRYCLDCGIALPTTRGLQPLLRRVWLRRIGWYPGDFVWAALCAAALAAAGAVAAVSAVNDREGGGRGTLVPPAPTTLSSSLPTLAGGLMRWPGGLAGWTVVLASLPASTHAGAVADALATRAVAAGLPQVGVLDSSRAASLQPGYLVVFSGVYGDSGDAEAALHSIEARGYAGAFAREIVT